MNGSIYIKQIVAIFWIILVALVIMFTVTVYFSITYGPMLGLPKNNAETLKSIIVILALIGVPAGYSFHKRRLKKIPGELPLIEKLKIYRNSFFIKIVFVEALAILTLTGYLITSDNVFLLIFGLFFMVYLLNTPNKEKITSEIELNRN